MVNSSFLSVTPLTFRPALTTEATVQVATEDKATHTLKLADGTLVPVRVELRELAKVQVDDPLWDDLKRALLHAGVGVAVAVAALCALRLVAITFHP